MSWYDPTSWGVDWLGGNTAKAPDVKYGHQGQIEDTITQGLANTQNRAAPQAAGPTTGPQDQWRAMQMGQAQQLQGIASGQQQGAGELAARRAAQAATAQQVGMANMQRGGAAPGAGLAAARNMVNIGGAAAGQAQQAALQDQQAANAQLAGALGQGRSGDQAMAQMEQQARLANIDAQLRQTGMNDQARLQYLAQLTGMDANLLAAQMQQYATQKNSGGGVLGGIMSTFGGIGGAMASNPGMAGGAAGGAGGAAGAAAPAAAMASDERLKDGIIAQDMERTRAGKDIVFESDEGNKMLDVNKSLGALLASSARLNERLRKLEGGD